MTYPPPFLEGFEPIVPFWKRSRRCRLYISFSGGKSSAYMLVRIFTEFRGLWDEIVVVFANTGQEDERTLEYVRDVAAQWNIPVVWVEAVVDPKRGRGHATTHRIVTFETASRKGQPFLEVIKKYGISNNQYPHCTRELKERPMWSYLESIGWEPDSHDTAVGMRFDEMDRMSPSWMARGVFYPLIDLRVTKADVLAWDRAAPVRLGLPEHRGNCVWCWKKSLRKLATVALEDPAAFDFPAAMERDYKDAGAGAGDRRFFRNRLLTSDIFTLARDPNFQPFVDGFAWQSDEMDSGMACGDGCEIGTDGPTEVPKEDVA